MNLDGSVRHALLSATLAAVAVGCGGTKIPSDTTTNSGKTEGEAETSPLEGEILLEEGVSEVAVLCQAGAGEGCNGLDDNCNGQIDEGCGYRGGAIQVTTAWNTRADLDVFITEPTGETLSFQHPESTSGGVMDHAARAGCGADFTRDQIENAFWAGDRIRKGDYRVSIHYWGECEGGGATTGAVTVALSGKVLGTYNLQLNPGTRRDVLTIRVR